MLISGLAIRWCVGLTSLQAELELTKLQLKAMRSQQLPQGVSWRYLFPGWSS